MIENLQAGTTKVVGVMESSRKQAHAIVENAGRAEFFWVRSQVL